MTDHVATLVTLVWMAGFSLTLWAGVNDRFRLKPYGLPKPLRVVSRDSAVATLCTVLWFIYVPGWFAYRFVIRHTRSSDRTVCQDD